MKEELKNIKELLFDAPVEVKKSFNQVVEYFAVRPMLGIYALFEVTINESKSVVGNPKLLKYEKSYRTSELKLPIKKEGKKYYWRKVCDDTITKYISKI